jgi:hypothetical protein
MRNAYKVLIGENLKVRDQFGTARRKWEDNIKIGAKEIGWGCGLHSTVPGQRPEVDTSGKRKKRSCFIRGGAFLKWLSGYHSLEKNINP